MAKEFENPAWHNTLRRFSAFGHIIDHAEVALELGYPYILWNDRIYGAIQDLDGNVCAIDTVLDINYLK